MRTDDLDNPIGTRMDCSLWRSIRRGYFWKMIRYCRHWGWRYFWLDSFGIGRDYSNPKHWKP